MGSVQLLNYPPFKVSTSLKGGQFEKVDTLRGGEVEKPVSIAGIVFTLSGRTAGIENEVRMSKGLASYCKAETTFTFYFIILPLSRAFLSINNREMKSESGFSLAMASH